MAILEMGVVVIWICWALAYIFGVLIILEEEKNGQKTRNDSNA